MNVWWKRIAMLGVALGAATGIRAGCELGGKRSAGPGSNCERELKLPKLEFRDLKLDNGLRVILVPDHSAPVYAIDVCYNVGSRNERPGRTGFAHLFEHMMFQGSENVGKGEHFTPGVQQRRRNERHDQRRPHHLFRRTAEESAWTSDCFLKPIACAR